MVSSRIRHPARTYADLLRGFCAFYEPLVPHRGDLVVGTFDEVVGGELGAITRRLNARFGTTLRGVRADRGERRALPARDRRRLARAARRRRPPRTRDPPALAGARGAEDGAAGALRRRGAAEPAAAGGAALLVVHADRGRGALVSSVIFGVRLDELASVEQLRGVATGFLDGDRAFRIFTPNPEILLHAREDTGLRGRPAFGRPRAPRRDGRRDRADAAERAFGPAVAGGRDRRAAAAAGRRARRDRGVRRRHPRGRRTLGRAMARAPRAQGRDRGRRRHHRRGRSRPPRRPRGRDRRGDPFGGAHDRPGRARRAEAGALDRAPRRRLPVGAHHDRRGRRVRHVGGFQAPRAHARSERSGSSGCGGWRSNPGGCPGSCARRSCSRSSRCSIGPAECGSCSSRRASSPSRAAAGRSSRPRCSRTWRPATTSRSCASAVTTRSRGCARAARSRSPWSGDGRSVTSCRATPGACRSASNATGARRWPSASPSSSRPAGTTRSSWTAG